MMGSDVVFSVAIFLQFWGVYCSIPQGRYLGDQQIGKCGTVHLTVSSLQDTHLELNWVSKCDNLGDIIPDYIILSNKDLRDRNEDSPPLKKIKAFDYPSGYYKTRIKFGQPWLPGNWEYSENNAKADPGPHCFPYWISSFKYDTIIDSKCLAIQPTWMFDNRQALGSQKIGNIFLPGTHNSGSFNGIPSFIEGYILNQDRSVWTQLVFGIRYLDFRIGYYSQEGGFFVNHDQVRVTKIEPILKEIRKFVELAPHEVIVVDFHRFPYPRNFTKELHRQFTNLVYEYLGNFALLPSGLQMGSGPTLNEIWAQNKNLIICYADRHTVNNNFWLWQPIQQFWGDTNKVTNLKSFISRSITQHKTSINPMWALMAELTPQPLDFIIRINNLRVLAQNVNKEVTKWFRDEWFAETNIVATDYFLGNDLIIVAIEANKRRV